MRRLSSILILSCVFLAFLVSAAWASYATERVAGADRYATSVLMSQKYWNDGSETVLLATGAGFADALTGAPLAGHLEAPILLTKPNELPDVVAAEIQRLGAKQVIILGGVGAVSQIVANELQAMNLNVRRIAGTDRYDTARYIAKEINSPEGMAYIVTGLDFPDALSVSAVAAIKPATPILLVTKDSIPLPTTNAINELNIETAFIIGGEGVISDAVKEDLPISMRMAGRDRYETSMLMAQGAIMSSMMEDVMNGDETPELDVEKLFIASGTNFPDALSGGPVAAMNGTGLVLTDPNVLSFGAKVTIAGIHESLENSILVGGTGALSTAVENEVQAFSNEDTVEEFMTDPETMKTMQEISLSMLEGMIGDLSDLLASLDIEDLEP